MSGIKAPHSIVDLAPELLELILSYLPPQELTRFGATCHRAYVYIRPDNQLLWKQAFLHVFDHPKHAWQFLTPTARATNKPREASWDWHRELVRRVNAFNLVLESDKEALDPEIENVVTALLDIQQTASRTNTIGPGWRVSLNLLYLQRLVRRSPDFDCIVHDFSRDPSSLAIPRNLTIDLTQRVTRSMFRRGAAAPQWASHFHIIQGPTDRENENYTSRAAARAIVYDWRVTGPEADYGPFIKDSSGRVNWQAVEAISSLMHRVFDTSLKPYNLHPTGFDIHMPCNQPVNPAVPNDWAGVTGSWAGTYAFLDYRALVHYNFTNHLDDPTEIGRCEEACGDLMRLDLAIDNSDELKQDKRLETDLPYCKDLPKLFFQGTSTRQVHERPSIDVRGVAFLAPGGREVRWRLIISYADADQWQLEGVQPSGIRSGGIYGLWSHVDHDDHGPMGPFYYANSELCKFSFDD